VREERVRVSRGMEVLGKGEYGKQIEGKEG